MLHGPYLSTLFLVGCGKREPRWALCCRNFYRRLILGAVISLGPRHVRLVWWGSRHLPPVMGFDGRLNYRVASLFSLLLFPTTPSLPSSSCSLPYAYHLSLHLKAYSFSLSSPTIHHPSSFSRFLSYIFLYPSPSS